MAAAIRSMNKYLSLVEARIREAEETPKAPDAPNAGQNNPGVKFQNHWDVYQLQEEWSESADDCYQRVKEK